MPVWPLSPKRTNCHALCPPAFPINHVNSPATAATVADVVHFIFITVNRMHASPLACFFHFLTVSGDFPDQPPSTLPDSKRNANSAGPLFRFLLLFLSCVPCGKSTVAMGSLEMLLCQECDILGGQPCLRGSAGKLAHGGGGGPSQSSLSRHLGRHGLSPRGTAFRKSARQFRLEKQKIRTGFAAPEDW